MINLVTNGSAHTFDPMLRHGRMLAEHTSFLSENFNCIPSNRSIALPKSPPEYIQVPVFRSKVSALTAVSDGPAPMDVLFHKIMENIQNEFKALRVREVFQASTAVTLHVAMAMLGCKRSRVFNLLKQGLLKRAPKVGRSVLVTVASIEELTKQGLPQKTRRWSCRSRQQPIPTEMKARNRSQEKIIGGAIHDPGNAIRSLTI